VGEFNIGCVEILVCDLFCELEGLGLQREFLPTFWEIIGMHVYLGTSLIFHSIVMLLSKVGMLLCIMCLDGWFWLVIIDGSLERKCFCAHKDHHGDFDKPKKHCLLSIYFTVLHYDSPQTQSISNSQQRGRSFWLSRVGI
jgi:hypothetical protein